MYCLQASPRIYQPGKFTSLGSEGVNNCVSYFIASPHYCLSVCLVFVTGSTSEY